MSYISI